MVLGMAGMVQTLWDGTLGAVTYVFYLTKYLEYFDTFVLALRKKNIIVLHQWHHSCMTIVRPKLTPLCCLLPCIHRVVTHA